MLESGNTLSEICMPQNIERNFKRIRKLKEEKMITLPNRTEARFF